MTIASAEQGDANQWSYDLAQKLNTAGAKGEDAVKSARSMGPTAFSSKKGAR
jgi:hypothetical protein